MAKQQSSEIVINDTSNNRSFGASSGRHHPCLHACRLTAMRIIGHSAYANSTLLNAVLSDGHSTAVTAAVIEGNSELTFLALHTLSTSER